MNVGYVRVSTDDQTVERQIENMKDCHIDKFFSEKASAKNLDRPQLQEMLKFVREGDVIYIDEFSRLARNLKDLLTVMDELNEKKVKLVSLKEKFDIDTPAGKVMLAVTGAIAQMEREYTLERQREGISIAKAAGKYKGRKKIERKDFEKYYRKYKSRIINRKEFALLIDVSRPTLNRMIDEYENSDKAKESADVFEELENQEILEQLEDIKKAKEEKEQNEYDEMRKKFMRTFDIDERQMELLESRKRRKGNKEK